MDREIPIYFDSIVLESSPIQEISTDNSNVYHLKVRVFTKYANRNGSYITEEVANQLIESATNGVTPVVGFFDPETQSWASHTGPTLANAYGYIDNFLGWEPFTDTDGVTRDYAVFSVNLFTEYFEEAKKIIGQNQSMELDPASITGDWAEINSEYYYVYKTAKMLGFCVIGSHEPCFSVSAFFSKDENTRKEELSHISSLLFDLKQRVEEIEKNNKGGELLMNEFVEDSTVTTEPEVVTEFEQTEKVETEVVPEVTEESVEVTTEFEATNEAESDIVESVEQPSEFEVLQNKFNELNEKFNELNTKYEEALASIAESDEKAEQAAKEFADKYAVVVNENEQLKEISNNYNNLIAQMEATKKNELIEKYEKLISEEEISHIREQVNDFSFDELESKLAIAFANKQMAGSDNKKVPLPEPQESQFALLMKKYRKN